MAGTDTYGLYDTRLTTDQSVAGIARSGTSGNYHYTVIGSPNHPVTYVDFGNAMRFINWLQNGQPTGLQNANTTENGEYTLNGTITSAGLSTVVRNAGAKWLIPTTDEWYKAAYHQPASQGGDSDDYWAYPMMTNIEPYSDEPPGTTPDNTRVGNFFQDDGDVAKAYNNGWAVTGSPNYSKTQNYLTDVGAYISSPSYYGTFDQGGNVYEWNETQVGRSRVMRGGSWYSATYWINAAGHQWTVNTSRNENLGFRVATISVPEPTSGVLLAVGLPLMSTSGRRRASATAKRPAASVLLIALPSAYDVTFRPVSELPRTFFPGCLRDAVSFLFGQPGGRPCLVVFSVASTGTRVSAGEILPAAFS